MAYDGSAMARPENLESIQGFKNHSSYISGIGESIFCCRTFRYSSTNKIRSRPGWESVRPHGENICTPWAPQSEWKPFAIVPQILSAVRSGLTINIYLYNTS